MTVTTMAPAENKRGGIDYSKFESIEDSDDEKPVAAPTATAKPQVAVQHPNCHNCHKETSKPLRCGICKKVSYCSTACQKDDWQFHKRSCKKPEEPKAAAKPPPPERRPPSDAPTEQKERKQKQETVIETEENLNWYRHRDWKPTEEPKREFVPQALDSSAVPSEEAPKPQAGSIWNSAGTWEEKDVTEVAQRTLKERLSGFEIADVDGGTLELLSVDSVEGDASKPVIRGKLRYMFDFSFKVKFIFRWMESSGQRKVDGCISVCDFTNDTFNEGVLSAPVVALKFENPKLLESAQRQAVEAALGCSSWPPSPGSRLAAVADLMKAWSVDYQQIS